MPRPSAPGMARPSGPTVMVSNGGRRSARRRSTSMASSASSGRPCAASTARSVSGPTVCVSPCTSRPLRGDAGGFRQRLQGLVPIHPGPFIIGPSATARASGAAIRATVQRAGSEPVPRGAGCSGKAFVEHLPCAVQDTGSGPRLQAIVRTLPSPPPACHHRRLAGRVGAERPRARQVRMMRAWRRASSRRCIARIESCGGRSASAASGAECRRSSGAFGSGMRARSRHLEGRELRELLAPSFAHRGSQLAVMVGEEQERACRSPTSSPMKIIGICGQSSSSGGRGLSGSGSARARSAGRRRRGCRSGRGSAGSCTKAWAAGAALGVAARLAAEMRRRLALIDEAVARARAASWRGRSSAIVGVVALVLAGQQRHGGHGGRRRSTARRRRRAQMARPRCRSFSRTRWTWRPSGSVARGPRPPSRRASPVSAMAWTASKPQAVEAVLHQPVERVLDEEVGAPAAGGSRSRRPRASATSSRKKCGA